MTSLESLKVLFERKHQCFICAPAGRDSDDKTYTAHIKHEVTTGLSQVYLKRLEGKIGYQKQLFSLYKLYGSIRLYCDLLSDASAFYIAHPDEWNELSRELKCWFDGLSSSERDELLPGWLDDAVIIGEIPSSGNYYLYLYKGDEAGQIYEFEHDGFEFIKIAQDIEGFIYRLCTVNDELIKYIQSYMRFSDGQSDTQWLPVRYEYGE